MKPICVQCQRFFKPKKNGYPFVEGMPTVALAPAGADAPDKWRPYKLWMGDLYECPGCGGQVISGVGREAIAEHFQPDFERTVKSFGPKLQVNDC